MPASPPSPSQPHSPPHQARLKLLRHQRGLTLEQLAAASGLTKSYLSKVERGLSTPSVGAALNIARSLGVDVAALFGAEAEHGGISVNRANGNWSIATGAAERDHGRGIEILAVDLAAKQMQPFLMTPPAEFADGPLLHAHSGEEFLYVLSGEVEIAFPQRSERLAAGDSIYFRAALPHRLRRLSDAAQVLLVISADTTDRAA